jgi:hypothetical protein
MLGPRQKDGTSSLLELVDLVVLVVLILWPYEPPLAPRDALLG